MLVGKRQSIWPHWGIFVTSEGVFQKQKHTFHPWLCTAENLPVNALWLVLHFNKVLTIPDFLIYLANSNVVILKKNNFIFC